MRGKPQQDVCLPRRVKVSATDVIAMAIYEHWVLVPGRRGFARLFIMPSAPTPPPLTLQLFLDFCVFLQRGGPRGPLRNAIYLEPLVIWPTSCTRAPEHHNHLDALPGLDTTVMQSHVESHDDCNRLQHETATDCNRLQHSITHDGDAESHGVA